MPELARCPSCGAELPSDSPRGQCVQCLLRLGLGDEISVSEMDRISKGNPLRLDAIIDKSGNVTLLKLVQLPEPRRALVTILDEVPPTLPEPSKERKATSSSWHLHYELLHALGVGGMGRTLKVRDRHTGRVLCLKELKAEVDKRVLLQECRALARLSHPRLVRLLNFDTDAEIPYLVMEYLDGVTLAGYLREHGALPERIVIRLAEDLFDATAYAHSQELIHRDLKPGNIMLRHPPEDLGCVVLDFGLAVVDRRDHLDIKTALGCIAGTAAYMAPEQLEGKELTGACDVYALGQVMWEMVTGRDAFRSLSELARKMEMPSGLEIPRGHEVSRGLARLISHCMRAKPSQRPTAQEALANLRQLREPDGGVQAERALWWRFWR